MKRILLVISCFMPMLVFAGVPLFPENMVWEGQGIALEPMAMVCAWQDYKATPSWNFELKDGGEFYLYLEMARHRKYGHGKNVDLMVDGEKVGEFQIQKTVVARDYKLYCLNKEAISLTAGKHRLMLKSHKQGEFVCRIRSGALVPEKDYRNWDEIVRKYAFDPAETFEESMARLQAVPDDWKKAGAFQAAYRMLFPRFPHKMCWVSQDGSDREEANADYAYDYGRALRGWAEGGVTFGEQLLRSASAGLPENAQLQAAYESSTSANAFWKLYEKACRMRRRQHLDPLLKKTDRVIFAKHQVFGSKSMIYNMTETEGLHAGQKSELCSIDLNPEKSGKFAEVSVLKDAEGGIIRDPELSYDAKHLLFAWRKTSEHIITNSQAAPDTANYQIYEMDLETGAVRQLTTDETYGANYEACYMPSGDILFNSARIIQHITCGFGDHSNLFMMNKDGLYQRRIGFDQVSSQFPTVLNNGQVIFLRRDYNDRGQSAAHALFVMNTDGTGQTEFYGNQTGTPNSFMHARAIPGSDKVACILSGYHTRQGGQLAIMDIRKGRNYGEGIVEVPQQTKPLSTLGHDDGYRKIGVQSAYPHPLSETEFVLSRSEFWAPVETGNVRGEQYGVYFMTADGHRELLAYDPVTSCLHPTPVIARMMPPIRPSLTDYRKDTGTFYVQNVYLGAAAVGITNTVTKIRVVEVLYKHAGVRSGKALGPGGGYDTITPPAHPLALFDAKRIIGEATVYEDGSAMFEAPARTPVYFQLLDKKNRCLQTMRSWSTLMPGERFSCVGCHEDKNDTPVVNARTIAMTKGVETLAPFYGPSRGFSYLKEVQPVFDKHCISCHVKGGKAEKLELTTEPFALDTRKEDGRSWARSYVMLMAARPGPDPSAYWIMNGPREWQRRGKKRSDEPNKYVQYWGRLGRMGLVPPYFAGAISSGMIKKLDKGHANVKLSQEEWDKLVAWIDLNCPYSGDYMENNSWTPEEQGFYRSRITERQRNEAIEAKAITDFIEAGQP